MKHLQKYTLFESVLSNDEEYFDAVSLFYDDELIDMIKQGDEMALNMVGNRDIKTEKSDDGNLLVRYCEGNGLLLILGAVTKSGKMNRGDIEDMKSWLNYAVDELENGVTVMSSPNDLSEPFIKKIIKMAEKKGLDLEIESHDALTHEDMTWKNYIIKVK